jgi:hypothetical protein
MINEILFVQNQDFGLEKGYFDFSEEITTK